MECISVCHVAGLTFKRVELGTDSGQLSSGGILFFFIRMGRMGMIVSQDKKKRLDRQRPKRTNQPIKKKGCKTGTILPKEKLSDLLGQTSSASLCIARKQRGEISKHMVATLMVECRVEVKSHDSDKCFALYRSGETCHAFVAKTGTKLNGCNAGSYQFFCHSFRFVIVFHFYYSQTYDRRVHKGYMCMKVILRDDVNKCRFCCHDNCFVNKKRKNYFVITK